MTGQGSRQNIFELLNHLMSCHNILFQLDIPCDFQILSIPLILQQAATPADDEATSSVTEPCCHFHIPIHLRDCAFSYI